jgi:hypothetical protein
LARQAHESEEGYRGNYGAEGNDAEKPRAVVVSMQMRVLHCNMVNGAILAQAIVLGACVVGAAMLEAAMIDTEGMADIESARVVADAQERQDHLTGEHRAADDRRDGEENRHG